MKNYYEGLLYKGKVPRKYKDILFIHDSAIIHSGCVLCGDGFGYTRDDNKLSHRKHDFGVIIYDNVTIHSGCVVDRGRYRDTVIDSGTKIDALTHIGHNSIIGENCMIGSNVNILGSCEIGDGTEIWSGAVINQGVKIGMNCIIGAQSYVRHDVKDGQKVFGVPATKRI